jgi:hypothetical protein
MSVRCDIIGEIGESAVSDLQQSRRLEILSGSKSLGPSGNFCIGLISAIAAISLPQHDLLSVKSERGFPTFHNRGTARGEE